MKQISEWIDEIAKAAMQAQERMLIDDIIDIYKGEYEDYGEYLKTNEQVNELTKKFQEEMSICVEPILLAEPIFNYIKNKGESDKK